MPFFSYFRGETENSCRFEWPLKWAYWRSRMLYLQPKSGFWNALDNLFDKNID